MRQGWLLVKVSSVKCWLIEKIKEKDLVPILVFPRAGVSRAYSTVLRDLHSLLGSLPHFSSVFTFTKGLSVFPHPWPGSHIAPCDPFEFRLAWGTPFVISVIFPRQTSPFVPSWLSPFTCSFWGPCAFQCVLGLMCP